MPARHFTLDEIRQLGDVIVDPVVEALRIETQHKHKELVDKLDDMKLALNEVAQLKPRIEKIERFQMKAAAVWGVVMIPLGALLNYGISKLKAKVGM